MKSKQAEKLMVVVLNDLVEQSIPRIHAIHHKLIAGEVLVDQELEYCRYMLRRLGECYHRFAHDPQCVTIFSCVAHLLYQVVNLAYENEQSITH